MGQGRDTIRRILEKPTVYNLLQQAIGADHFRTRYVEEYVQPFSGARILDIACGPGTILDYLPESVEYTGVDLNPRYIATAKSKYGRRAQSFCAPVSQAPWERLQEEFDIVLANAVFYHLDDNEADQLISSASHYLRSGGSMVSFDCVIPWVSLASNDGSYPRTVDDISDHRKNIRVLSGGIFFSWKRLFSRVCSEFLIAIASYVPENHELTPSGRELSAGQKCNLPPIRWRPQGERSRTTPPWN